MNAFIAAVIEKKTILIANEGRLLKKSFLGFAILMMAFQTNAFGDLVRQTLVDAYLQVSVFVGFTLFIFIGKIKYADVYAIIVEFMIVIRTA